MLIQQLPPTGESAFFRARYPKSWWWTPTTDMLSLILHAVQGANWQRSGGKGRPPDRVERPTETVAPTIRSADELKKRRAAYDAELKRRRQQKQRKGA